MKMPKSFAAFVTFLTWLLISSGDSLAQARTIYVRNKCLFKIWPAILPDQGQTMIEKGGFLLEAGQSTDPIEMPDAWTGRLWARTKCDFSSIPACETGDCEGVLECNGKAGRPPMTTVEFSMMNKSIPMMSCKVSVVDGYNLPVSVSTRTTRKCQIRGCLKNLKTTCPEELQTVNKNGEVVGCKSACLAYGIDRFCCKNDFGIPEKCQPNMYSKFFKQACPSYFSYAFDNLTVTQSEYCQEYLITFCPLKWGSKSESTESEHRDTPI